VLSCRINTGKFIQFHPTVFYDPSAVNESERRFLLTEALRGSGAFLKLHKDSDEDFVLKYDELGSKATRDVVSKAEDIEMRKNGLRHVWLDCTKIPEKKLKQDFKNSYEFCLSKGYDLTKEPVPVVYAEHFSNGGVLVDENSETAIKGCYVIGETSYTGLHGATRLASNSGPECVLFARIAAKHFLNNKDKPIEDVPVWKTGKAKQSRDRLTAQYYWELVRRTMTLMCGMSRNKERLTAAKEVIDSIKTHIRNYYWNYKVSKDFLEVRNIVAVASIILESALKREETRACHIREDFSDEDPSFEKLTLITKEKI
jgi:L-aspartate oxidase